MESSINLSDKTQTERFSVYIPVLVQFEITETEDGQKFYIRKAEIIDVPNLKKEIESELESQVANPENYRTEFVWEQ
jgi:hypothetical protein